MIKQALNAATIAEVMRRFTKDDAIKLLGRSTYNKWLKKLPTDRIASNTKPWFTDTASELRMKESLLNKREANRLKQEPQVSDALMDRYGPSFEANLPQTDRRLNTRGRLKGIVLQKMPRRNFLREFATDKNLVHRNKLLQWNRIFNAGLDPKTLTSEWYVKPKVGWLEMDTADRLNNPLSDSIYYNGKEIPMDTAYRDARTVRNIAAVPYTDRIRHKAAQLVANELHNATKETTKRRSIYNAASDNTRKVLNYVEGRNVLEDPVALRLLESAHKHGRLGIGIPTEFKDGTNAAFIAPHNTIAAHPRLTQNVKNHERSHMALHNMDAQEHADVASRAFRGIDAISRKNPEYSDLSQRLINLPHQAHEAVTDYYRHKRYGTLGSRVDDYKAQNALNTDARFTEPAVNYFVSETQNLTSNPSLQQALQQLALNYGVPLSTSAQVPESVIAQIRQAMNLN